MSREGFVFKQVCKDAFQKGSRKQLLLKKIPENSVKAHLHNVLIPQGMWEHQLCVSNGKRPPVPTAAQTKDGLSVMDSLTG